MRRTAPRDGRESGELRHPLASNPLHTRDDLHRAIVALCAPLESHRSPGGARIRVDGPRAYYTDTCQEMEGFSRLLWGIVPLLAGGGTYGAVGRVRDGLMNGCDPNHSEYWGTAGDFDQRLVEYAAIAFALMLDPETFWEPLSKNQRSNVSTFLAIINEREVYDNNWRFFRVLVNLALARLDAPFSSHQLQADLNRLDAFYLGDGWYADGCNHAVDYYGAYGMHFYGLLCARVLRDTDAERARLFMDRATAFAGHFVHWFSEEGAAIPYGRSATYRFAPAAFWSALAFAGVEAAPWGVIKGLVLRHLRWWFRQPIFSDGGLLTTGYAYATQTVAERYGSPCSPYWALKVFAPAALLEDTLFWRAEEQELPQLEATVAQRHSGLIVCRHGAHVFALAAAARVPERLSHASAKYGKFCYSTHFGFSLPGSPTTLSGGAYDSALALSESGDGYYRVRERSDTFEVSSTHIVSRWTPWPDVQVTTWLIPTPPWHVRVHRVRTARPVSGAEGGFAVGLGPDEARCDQWTVDSSNEWVGARTELGASAIVNLFGERSGETVYADPNTNVLFSRTVIPTLLVTLPPGEHWLACAVVASCESHETDLLTTTRPTFTLGRNQFDVGDHRGRLILREPV